MGRPSNYKIAREIVQKMGRNHGAPSGSKFAPKAAPERNVRNADEAIETNAAVLAEPNEEGQGDRFLKNKSGREKGSSEPTRQGNVSEIKTRVFTWIKKSQTVTLHHRIFSRVCFFTFSFCFFPRNSTTF